MSKHPLEIARDELAKTDNCNKCGKPNQDPNFGGFRLYESKCKHCGASMCHSYLFAPWSLTWEELQQSFDKVNEQLGGRGFKK